MIDNTWTEIGITSATLSLWTTGDLSDNDRTIRVYRLKTAFAESSATWNESASGVSWQSAGASGTNDRESTDIGSVLVLANEADGTEKQISLNTTKIEEMVSGAFTNNGFIIIADTELNDRFNYKSSDASTASQRPKLVIQYTTSTPTPGPSPTPTNTPSGPTQTPTRTPTSVGTNTPTSPPTTPPPSFQNATFVYDGDGKRVKSTFNGTITTYFVGTHFELTGSTVTKYYYAGSQRIAMRTGTWDFSNPVTGTLNFLLGDHLGSTSLTTDAAGNKVSEIRYKAWGTVRYATENVPTKYQYTGQYSYEAEFGLYFYNARWYDPVLSRFSQADSVLANPVWGWDRYAYVNNNPLAYTDPSGHKPCGDGEPWNCDGTTNTTTPPLDLGSSSTPDDADLIDVSLLKTERGLQLYNLYRTMWEDQDSWWWNRYGSGGFTIWEFMSIFLGYEQSLYPNSQHFATSLSNKAPVWCLYMGCNPGSAEGALDFIASYSQSARRRLNCLDSTCLGTAFNAPPLPSTGESMDIVEAIQSGGPGFPGGNELYDIGNVSLRPKIFKKMIALGMVNTVWGQKGQDRMIILTFCQAQMASYAAYNGGPGAINMRTYSNFCGG